ncbi:MAG TPA: hypothetical protein PKX48_10635 [Planctomycetota bacterium]|nr:hypothetical protein [Planctomycetota bacterium]OQC21066.1 MAG: hypothetical protein BWX69_01262 [Planctomycetes bacterium ADurb.Bin069]HNS00186.1 hypothetical protein [Planctomycetota bacterium]HNU26685.1 hypothetical protein [Planctomycetota bacterium]HOE30361.1 hypothetical protein [Planctomycetota bacterium]
MTEQPTTPETPAAPPDQATAPTPAPAAPGPDVAGNIKKLPLVEKIVFVLAVLVLIGWVIMWSRSGGWAFRGLSHWFPLLSFFGALAVLVLIVLKVLAVKFLPPHLERHAIPVASLLPVLGFVVENVVDVSNCLTVVGSLAMAYVSAMTYWRKHLPQIGEEAAPEGSKPPAAPPPNP